jgi:hypothetical protein
MCSTLTSFARKYFAFGSFTAALLLLLASGTPAMAQQQPQQPVVPGPFQGLANILRNPNAPQPRPPVNPQPQPAPPPTIIPPGTLDNGAR